MTHTIQPALPICPLRDGIVPKSLPKFNQIRTISQSFPRLNANPVPFPFDGVLRQALARYMAQHQPAPG